MAALLTTHDVGHGSCVGVCDDRSPATVVALLAILKAGAAYVGMDGSMPVPRLRRLMHDAGIAVVCRAVGSALHPDDMSVTVLEVGVDGDGAEPYGPGGTAGRTERAHCATDVAYVSFTSGSTGEPKGVEVLHRGVVRLVRGSDYVDLGPDEVVLAAAPLAFDASTFEIWAPLLTGGRLVLVPPGARSTAELADVLTDHHVTTAWFTAAIFHQMVDHQISALSSLRQVLAGGDVMSPAHVNRLLKVLVEGGAVINGYGPTEGTTFTCCHRMAAGGRIEGSVPIGTPIANTWVVIGDDTGRPVPDGVPGELWIGGDGVARGYVGRPDLTALHFIDNPFAILSGARLYRSGDRVRRRGDGTLEFLGRIDRQLKVRGHRVEPAETEAALTGHPAIAQAHVLPVEFGRDDKRLVAYLVGTGTPEPGASAADQAGDPSASSGRVGDDDLKEFLGRTLPRYMVPEAYLWLERLPLRANGKIDVGRLPAPPSAWFPEGHGAPEIGPHTTLARPLRGANRMEAALIAIWQEVTGFRTVGLHDDFFDLGGHSLLAVELFAAIERSTGARLPLATIFEAPTVAQLAEVLRSDGWDAHTGSLVPLATGGSRPPIFAVTAGDGNVVGYGPLARRLAPDQPFYVLQPFGLESSAPLHRTIESMARHDVRQIRKVQAHGPYLLVGRCYGALVAYEMAARLESAGETVALLASIDSIGPFWRTRHLANGVLYDPMMNVARMRAVGEGVGFGDVFSDRGAADRFIEWLTEPVAAHAGVEVSRYVHAAYLSLDDIQEAFPLGDGGDGGSAHAALVEWARVNGPSQLEMQEFLLPRSAPGSTDRPVTASKWHVRRQDVAARALDWVNFATRGAIPSLAERRRDEVLRIAYANVVRYRAPRIRATVTLLLCEEDVKGLQMAQLARWSGLEVGGIDQHVVAGSHHGMLREPAVASLADCLDRCITSSLEAAGSHVSALG